MRGLQAFGLGGALLAPGLGAAPLPSGAAVDGAGLQLFETKIRPVLVKQCYGCHSSKAGAPKGGLLLDTRAGLLKGGVSGPAVVPGKPAESLLIRSLQHTAGGPKMPPAGKLSSAVAAGFEQWVRLGAPDPREGGVVVKKSGMSVDEGRKFWSFRPPVRVAPPKVRQTAWPRGPIDRFILAKLEQQGLPPVADADRRSLIRRVYFDLIGLPPTPEEVDQFAGDRSPDAYEKVVDRLLASRHFGERWGRHWLDAARYADSNGRDRNMFFFHAWRYRDYVIQAFNADKPYDRFIREQVAGDLLPAGSPEQQDEQRIATGFLALGAKAFEEPKPEVFRMDTVDEQIDVLGRSVLGLSVACARCHDHKFDPIPTRDYYALAGIFRSTRTLYGYGPLGSRSVVHSELQPVGPLAAERGEGGRRYFLQLNEQQLKLNTARSDRYRVVRRVADAKVQIEKPGADREALQKSIEQMQAEILEWDVKVAALAKGMGALMDNPPPLPGWAMGARDHETPEDCKIHIRGETTNLGEAVPRGTLQVISLPGEPRPTAGSGRRELAEWLASPRNPLTPRVFVNRVWLHLFGRGLVSTPDDFGVKGAPPSHPQLLDFLAATFVAPADEEWESASKGEWVMAGATRAGSGPSARWRGAGWSPKRLIREIVLSRTYRLSTEARAVNMQQDPDNIYRWRMSPRRLEAEVFRDAILAVSGKLDREPPAAPFLDGIHPRRDDELRAFQPVFTPEKIDHPHRSVYLPVIRGVLPEIYSLFDFAAPDRPVAQRDETTVPAQALYLMNNPWVVEQARHAARGLLSRPELNDAARVERLYQVALSRRPTTPELSRTLEYLRAPESLRPEPKTTEAPSPERLREERWTSFCQALFASAEFRSLR